MSVLSRSRRRNDGQHSTPGGQMLQKLELQNTKGKNEGLVEVPLEESPWGRGGRRRLGACETRHNYGGEYDTRGTLKQW